MGTTLGQPWPLHNIKDGEQLCRQVLNRAGYHTTAPDYEDALAHLLLSLWRIYQRYDPARDQPRPNFAAHAARQLDTRLIDYWRRNGHDNRRRNPHHNTTRLNILHPHTLHLLEPQPTSDGDHPTDRDAPLVRLLRDRARHRTQDLHLLDQRAPRRPPTRTRAA